MYSTGFASQKERNEILEFMESRGIVENAWLAWFVDMAIGPSYPCPWYSALVCRRVADVAGVASLALNEKGDFTGGYSMYLDAIDGSAVDSILESLPEGSPRILKVFNRDVQEHLNKCPGLHGQPRELFYTLNLQVFRPVDSTGIVELSPADSYLFEGHHHQPDWEHSNEGTRLFAIVRDDRVAAHVYTSPIGPVMPCGKRVFDIGGLFTTLSHRRKGYAKSLVSHITALILEDGNIPMYWTETDNTASQGLCAGLGYKQYAQQVIYRWS